MSFSARKLVAVARKFIASRMLVFPAVFLPTMTVVFLNSNFFFW